jgi:hypothetical protein
MSVRQELGMVMLLGCRCRCGHEWLPRRAEERPKVCPKCKSPNWERPFERRKVSLTARQLSLGVWTHDLGFQVPRAVSEDDRRLLVKQTVDYYRAHPGDSARMCMAMTPEQQALSAVQTSVEQLTDEYQRLQWVQVLETGMREALAHESTTMGE